jgi:hypothetical protein
VQSSSDRPFSKKKLEIDVQEAVDRQIREVQEEIRTRIDAPGS